MIYSLCKTIIVLFAPFSDTNGLYVRLNLWMFRNEYCMMSISDSRPLEDFVTASEIDGLSSERTRFMKNRSFLDKALLLEQKRSTLVYTSLFLLIGLLYHLFYYYYMAKVEFGNFHLQKFLVLSIPYCILIIQFPIQFLVFKTKFAGLFKYFYLGSFILSATISDIVSFNITGHYDGGNIGELLMVMFAPIFVNASFFWYASLGLVFKYGSVVLLYPSLLPRIVLPLALLAFVVFMGYFILLRFMAYVKSLNDVYNNHFSNMVSGIVAMLELKDPHTKGHSERVARYSVTLARRVGGFSEQELNTFYYSCLLHDIGKIQISDDILTKPDRLTPDEYEVVKMHTIFGADSIKDIESLQPCTEIIRHHHERWDGTGYPDGLEGEKIPLLTRIASIADAFDAMTSHRSYRAALTPDEAYSRIIKGGGTQFDPNLIPYFKNVFPTWLSILHDYHETHEEEYNRLYGALYKSVKGVNL